MDRLILDTGVGVATVRGRATVPDDADIAIPAVAIAEYLAGVSLDPDAGRQAAQKAFLNEVLAVIPVCDYTEMLPSTTPPARHTHSHAAARTTSSSPPPPAPPPERS